MNMFLNENQAEEFNYSLNSNIKILLKDFNAFLLSSLEIEFMDANINLEFLDTGGYRFSSLKCVHTEVIINFMREYFIKEEHSKFFSKLQKHGYFNLEKSLLNPQLTIFGSFFTKYLMKLTEGEYEDFVTFKSVLPLSFDEELFNIIWEAFLPWFTNSKVRVRIFYLIFNVNLQGEDFLFDNKRDLQLKIPSKEEKKELIEEMNFRYFYFEGQFRAINRVQKIAECSAWIEGETELSLAQLEESFIELNILHGSYIEEAFSLLGYSEVFVGFFTLNNQYYPQKLTIQPPLEQNKGLAFASPVFQYPEWMQYSFFPPKSELILNQGNKDFLSFYPSLRRNLPVDSIIRLSLLRLRRSMKSKLIMDIILEITIGIESLLVDGMGDLSLQFRLNTSWFIGRNVDDRKILERFCKDLYTLRSKIVHEGGKTKHIEKITKKYGDSFKFIELARKLYRLIILKSVKIEEKAISFIHRSDLLEKVKDARLGSKLGILDHKIYQRSYEKFIENLKEAIKNE